MVNNVTTPIQCVAQNYAQMVTSRYMGDLEGSIQRSADMLTNGLVICASFALRFEPFTDAAALMLLLSQLHVLRV